MWEIKCFGPWLRTAYFKEHSPLVRVEVTGQDVPQPDDDTMAAVKSSIIDCVFPAREKKTKSISSCFYTQRAQMNRYPICFETSDSVETRCWSWSLGLNPLNYSIHVKRHNERRQRRNVTYLRSSRSISALSPEIRRWTSGVENMCSHSGLMMLRKPRMKAAVCSLICVCIRKWAMRWM